MLVKQCHLLLHLGNLADGLKIIGDDIYLVRDRFEIVEDNFYADCLGDNISIVFIPYVYKLTSIFLKNTKTISFKLIVKHAVFLFPNLSVET